MKSNFFFLDTLPDGRFLGQRKNELPEADDRTYARVRVALNWGQTLASR